MTTEAVFENIAERLQQEIGKAQRSIIVAVAWFTNRDIFEALLEKAKKGCTVSLIITNDEINANSSINFNELEQFNSKCYFIGDGETLLMHNKFCVIDYSTVITGSYNWSYKAESNYENIVIHENNTTLASQFVAEFERIVSKYFPNETKPLTDLPIDKIIKRLEILKNQILLEDIEELKREAKKLMQYNFQNAIAEIIYCVENNELAEAANKIQNFISQNLQVTKWDDPEAQALKLEIKILESQLSALDNEKIELEKVLHEFNHRHSIELGPLILEILELRKQKFVNDQEKYNEAEEDYKEYNKRYNEEKERKHFTLTNEEKTELKQKFRKATFLCHPDKVSEDFKEYANAVFIDLKAAYDANDLKRVSEILDELEKGNSVTLLSDTVKEKEKLKAIKNKLRMQINELLKELLKIKESDAYQTIICNENLDKYFAEVKEKLEKELQSLKLL